MGKEGERRRVHLPMVVTQPAIEPTVGEGTRSLSRWAAVRRDLAANPTLHDELLRMPGEVLARYGIAGSPAELQAFAESMRRSK